MGWSGRTVILFLAVVLAGGPAVAGVCDAACVASELLAKSAGTTGSPAGEHHHEAVADAAQAAPRGDDSMAVHEHHQSAHHDASPAPDSDPARISGFDCDRHVGVPPASLTASRVDRDVLPGSHAAASATPPALLDLESTATWDGPPPGNPPPTHASRPPLVLRL